jgi:16S rRNA A1518/A1519 N6-dimethyltransferase RsmA/KsgA/DIM1 with predicted DNA glycosylase/AP lyase activity
MPILLDPEGNESNALLNLPVAWTSASVLEIGSGDGRLTWRYADKVARIIAIEPDEKKHKAARANRPVHLKKIKFINQGLDEFAKQNKEMFDLAILSWSL